MSELLAYVDGFPDDHPFTPLTAIPDDVPLPPLWILGSSLYGGQAAAAFGTGFAFAGHFGSADPAEAVAGYRERFEPSDRLAEPRVILGVAAIAAETEERAEALAKANDLAMLRLLCRPPRPGADARGGGRAPVDRRRSWRSPPGAASSSRSAPPTRSATTWSGGAPTPTPTSW